MTFGGWAVGLNGVILTHSCENGQAIWDASECLDDSLVIDGLSAPPKGIGGVPEQRTEDTTYLQRDGVKHYSDWYVARFVTLQGSIEPDTSCIEDCVTVREMKFALVDAWKRGCCDVELVLFPPCTPGETQQERTFTGPYGIIGRPRVADGDWIHLPDNTQGYEFLLRFDSVDQRMYVLDECGSPGFQNCIELEPSSDISCIGFDDDGNLCFDDDGNLCLTTQLGNIVPPTAIDVAGTEQTFPVITLLPDLHSPKIINVTTGEQIAYFGDITGSPVVINTEEGTAFQDGESRTHLLSGSFNFSMFPGEQDISLMSSSAFDTGTALFCWRDTVVSA